MLKTGLNTFPGRSRSMFPFPLDTRGILRFTEEADVKQVFWRGCQCPSCLPPFKARVCTPDDSAFSVEISVIHGSA